MMTAMCARASGAVTDREPWPKVLSRFLRRQAKRNNRERSRRTRRSCARSASG